MSGMELQWWLQALKPCNSPDRTLSCPNHDKLSVSLIYIPLYHVIHAQWEDKNL